MVIMKIKMNEEKILEENIYNLKKVYECIDNVFAEFGITKEAPDEDGTLNYVGYNDEKDFGNMSSCCRSLEDINGKWFLPNCSTWLWGDDEAHEGTVEYEDVLEQIRQNNKRIC